ncbi:TPA: precorrin-6A reductase [Enterococcus faecalis]|uniref:precorrin-6A reductase n=1 Tax=Enterococcus faecalis TaxID=1351 RepID=UPI00114399AC|nr:precorrin-6A reductase [Enterococcus faecalis]EHV0153401.1 precorrin-6A reductase [Enterococcus faecalis]NSV46812.1 precorrin-6A reductase [Enterococcus faecalis]TQA42039.1 precorrin-6A reductase [Enterococcus faecalis]HDT8169908.1 precorrin-6A reductase [Enterococcus faecalis]
MILVLGGTSDSLGIAEQLEQEGRNVCFSVVSDYGEQLALKKVSHVVKGRLTKEDMVRFIQENQVDVLLDATHPFAAIVSKTAIEAAKTANIPYVRYERPRVDLKTSIRVKDTDEACQWVKTHIDGPVYLTTGSKTLHEFRDKLPLEMIVARVLPTAEVLQQTEALGFQAHQIEGIKGPFSVDMNKALMTKNQAAVMITKESGIAGGILEKIEACDVLGIPCVVITRESIAYPILFHEVEELCHYLEGLM